MSKFEVPNKKSMRNALIFSLALTLLFMGCKKSPMFLNPHFDVVTESEHFVYYQQSEDTIVVDEVWQENYFTWLTSQLDIQTDIRIDYYKYTSRAQLEELTGRSTNAFAQANQARIHTIWWKDNHECVHILTDKYWGLPPAIINEGMAVAHQAQLVDGEYVPGWNGQDFHRLAAEYLSSGELPSMEQMIDSHSFWDHEANMVYALAGSFVRFLLDTYGLDKVRDYHRGAGYWDKLKETDKRMLRAFGKTAAEIWQEWLDFLNNY